MKQKRKKNTANKRNVFDHTNETKNNNINSSRETKTFFLKKKANHFDRTRLLTINATKYKRIPSQMMTMMMIDIVYTTI